MNAGLQRYQIARMLETVGVEPDQIDLTALVDEELNLHENIENVENEIGRPVITGGTEDPEAESEKEAVNYRKLLEDGKLEPHIMKKQWLRVVQPQSLNLLVGAKRHGKSVLAYWLLEILHKEHKLNAYIYGLPPEKWHLIPEFADPLTILDLPEDSVILFDEAYMEFHARASMSSSNKQIDTIAGLVGQKNIIGLYITQTTRKLDVGIVGACDVVMWKKPSLLQMLFERPQFRKMTEDISEKFKQFQGDDVKKNTYVISDDFKGFLTNPVPDWWTEELSTAYKGVSLIGKKEQDTEQIEGLKCLHCDEDAVEIRDGESVCGKHIAISK